MIELKVGGMTCNHCVMAVTRAVKDLDPAAEVKVDLASGRVQVQTTVAAAQVAAAITEAGYEVLAPAG
ncbi:MAG TPA: cation transporter [Quisquiliibacterium sp.]|nr:cation transporter [Quisquiliibacterium sp.]